jgi:hypothetical protein
MFPAMCKQSERFHRHEQTDTARSLVHLSVSSCNITPMRPPSRSMSKQSERIHLSVSSCSMTPMRPLSSSNISPVASITSANH